MCIRQCYETAFCHLVRAMYVYDIISKSHRCRYIILFIKYQSMQDYVRRITQEARGVVLAFYLGARQRCCSNEAFMRLSRARATLGGSRGAQEGRGDATL